MVEAPFSLALTTWVDVESEATLYDGLSKLHQNKTRSRKSPIAKRTAASL